MASSPKYRVGDELTFVGKVVDVTPEDEVDVRVKWTSGVLSWVRSSDASAHKPAPRPLAVGDCVKVYGVTGVHRILAVDGSYAWLVQVGVKHPYRHTAAFGTLELVDG
jgi:hypothetical protein